MDVLGADGTEAWYSDGGPRSKARRRIDKAKALRDGGYRAAFLEPRRKRRRRGAAPDPGSGPGQAPGSGPGQAPGPA